jgi:ribose transport system ATP-binding protein
MDQLPARLAVENLSKTFGGHKALRGVGLTIAPGEIHALVGQNGSGKSTLVKILAGYHSPDSGAVISVDGRELEIPVTARERYRANLAIVHQDLGLVDHLTVAENIGLGQYAHSRWMRRIDWRQEHRASGAALARLGSDIGLQACVGALSPSERSVVAVARALRFQDAGKGVIVLDESTRALDSVELRSFYTLLRRAVDAGASVLVIAHNLNEVVANCDRATVFVDGQVAAAGLVVRDTSEADLARIMLARDVLPVARPGSLNGSAHVAVRDLQMPSGNTVDLEIGAGEIVGVTGISGSGYDAVPYFVAGALRPKRGVLRVGDKEINLPGAGPLDLAELGVALIPERRDREGLALELRISENIALPQFGRRGRPYYLGRAWERELSSVIVKKMDVRPPDYRRKVGVLSGGNQQKVLVGKWLASEPALLVMHEPTQGVDLAARHQILSALVDAAAGGMSMLLASADPADLCAVCHRVLIFRDGVISDEILDPTPSQLVDSAHAGKKRPSKLSRAS